MATAVPMNGAAAEPRASWAPLIAISLGQAIMSYNVASLPVAMSGMVESFGSPPTTVATGIVAYSMLVAGFVMLGAKLIQKFGTLKVFRTAVIVFGCAQALMTFSFSATSMIAAQALCGAAAAIIVPSLVALIAENYQGRQQETAVGALGSTRASSRHRCPECPRSGRPGPRPQRAFGLLMVVSAVVVLLSFRLKPDEGRPNITIDGVGVLLAAAAIILISFGFNNLNAWGFGFAHPGAPFTLLGLSPAPVMIVLGIVLGQAFFLWSRQREAANKTPLLPLSILSSPAERAAVYTMFSVVALEAALNFTVPLYIQIVQGRSPLATAVAMLPFNLTVFFAALVVVRFYQKFSPRHIARFSFLLCAAALAWLALVVRNDWSALPVLLGLIAFGIGQGALVTLVFNVLVTSAPKELAGDVGSLRGTANNLAAAVGTALAGALMVVLLSSAVMSRLAENPVLPIELQQQVNLDSINFVNNEQLATIIANTDASPEQKAEAMRINSEARLTALKIGLLLMSGLALLTVIPAGRLPRYRAGEIPPP